MNSRIKELLEEIPKIQNQRSKLQHLAALFNEWLKTDPLKNQKLFQQSFITIIESHDSKTDLEIMSLAYKMMSLCPSVLWPETIEKALQIFNITLIEITVPSLISELQTAKNKTLWHHCLYCFMIMNFKDQEVVFKPFMEYLKDLKQKILNIKHARIGKSFLIKELCLFMDIVQNRDLFSANTLQLIIDMLKFLLDSKFQPFLYDPFKKFLKFDKPSPEILNFMLEFLKSNIYHKPQKEELELYTLLFYKLSNHFKNYFSFPQAKIIFDFYFLYFEPYDYESKLNYAILEAIRNLLKSDKKILIKELYMYEILKIYNNLMPYLPKIISLEKEKNSKDGSVIEKESKNLHGVLKFIDDMIVIETGDFFIQTDLFNFFFDPSLIYFVIENYSSIAIHILCQDVFNILQKLFSQANIRHKLLTNHFINHLQPILAFTIENQNASTLLETILNYISAFQFDKEAIMMFFDPKNEKCYLLNLLLTLFERNLTPVAERSLAKILNGAILHLSYHRTLFKGPLLKKFGYWQALKSQKFPFIQLWKLFSNFQMSDYIAANAFEAYFSGALEGVESLISSFRSEALFKCIDTFIMPIITEISKSRNIFYKFLCELLSEPILLSKLTTFIKEITNLLEKRQNIKEIIIIFEIWSILNGYRNNDLYSKLRTIQRRQSGQPKESDLDLTILLNDEKSTKVSSKALMASSKVFEAMFSHSFSESEQKVLKLDLNLESFKVFYDSLFHQNLCFEIQNDPEKEMELVLQVLEFSFIHLCDEMIQKCLEYLLQFLFQLYYDPKTSQFPALFQLSFMNYENDERFLLLTKFCSRLVIKHFRQIEALDAYKEMPDFRDWFQFITSNLE